MKKTVLISSCLILVGATLIISRTVAQSSVSTLPRKILFIGHSFTYAQGGIYTHFEKLAAAATPPLVVTTDKAVAGGAFRAMQGPVKATPKDIGRNGWGNCRGGLVIRF